MKAHNKTIVVTGGGSGMGRELVLVLLDKGAKVVAIDINKTSLEETIKLAGDKKDKITDYVFDITDKSAVEVICKQMIDKLGQIDGVINNAGIIQPFKVVNELEFSTIERVFNVNFWGTLYLTKALLPHFLTRL